MILLLTTSTLRAQDPILSQYFANRMSYNPALTNYEGGINFNTHYRNQWVRTGLNANRRALFETTGFGLSLETPCRDIALGITYLDNTEGIGDLKWQHFGFATAYKSPILGTNRGKFGHQFFLGMKVSWNMYSLNNSDNFVFSDQLDAYQGLVNPNSAFWSQHANLPGVGYTDVDMGGAWAMRLDDRDRFRVGFSMQHLTRPDKSIFGTNSGDDKLGWRPTLHASMLLHDHKILGVIPSRRFAPSIKLDMQNLWFGRDSMGGFVTNPKYTFWSAQAGGIATYGSYNQIWVGGFVQGRFLNPQTVNGPNIYSLIGMVGMETNASADFQARIGVSWEFNVSGISSDGLGSLEAFLHLNLPTFSFNPNCNCGGRRGKRLVKDDPF